MGPLSQELIFWIWTWRWLLHFMELLMQRKIWDPWLTLHLDKQGFFSPLPPPFSAQSLRLFTWEWPVGIWLDSYLQQTCFSIWIVCFYPAAILWNSPAVEHRFKVRVCSSLVKIKWGTAREQGKGYLGCFAPGAVGKHGSWTSPGTRTGMCQIRISTDSELSKRSHWTA